MMGDGDSFSFSNSVTGGNAQINQGQNVTATQTNTGGEPSWPDAAEEARTEAGDEAAQDVETLQSLAEVEETPPEATVSHARAALERLKKAAPGALRTIAKIVRDPKDGAAAGIELVAGLLENR